MNKNLKKYKVLLEIINTIHYLFSVCDTRDWNGFSGLPLKNKESVIKFAKILIKKNWDFFNFSVLKLIPENEGGVCFDFYYERYKYLSVSVKGEELIYVCRVKNARFCGKASMDHPEVIWDLLAILNKYKESYK